MYIYIYIYIKVVVILCNEQGARTSGWQKKKNQVLIFTFYKAKWLLSTDFPIAWEKKPLFLSLYITTL